MLGAAPWPRPPAGARIDQATRLFGGTAQPIADIAQRVGFPNEGIFPRPFRHVAGFRPREYRQFL